MAAEIMNGTGIAIKVFIIRKHSFHYFRGGGGGGVVIKVHYPAVINI
jgi:hypothetical protein